VHWSADWLPFFRPFSKFQRQTQHHTTLLQVQCKAWHPRFLPQLGPLSLHLKPALPPPQIQMPLQLSMLLLPPLPPLTLLLT
jgi:hypothetical protein